MTIVEPLPQSIPVDVIEPLLSLTECVCTELAATGGGPLCWCGIYPGLSVSWEYCGECKGGVCGMGWVRVAAVFPYSTFPTPVVDLTCTNPLAAQVEIGALRCMPVPADGEPISAEVATEVSVLQLADAWALWRAVMCCDSQFALGIYTPTGPEGACVGGFWTAYLPLN